MRLWRHPLIAVDVRLEAGYLEKLTGSRMDIKRKSGGGPGPMIHGRSVERCAEIIFRGFESYCERFGQLTRQTRVCFEIRDWAQMRSVCAVRLDLYHHVLSGIVDRIRGRIAENLQDKWFWSAVKRSYRRWLENRLDTELAETFFNSVTRRMLVTVGVDPRVEFVNLPLSARDEGVREQSYRSYFQSNLTIGLFERLVLDFQLQAEFKNLRRDIRLSAARVEQQLHILGLLRNFERVDMLHQPLFRDNGAYLVGRLVCGTRSVPLILSLLHPAEGLVIDGILLDQDQASILFSYTRSCFHVEIERPADWVGFLRSILPGKRVSELYTVLGFDRHGKTELYRELLSHTDLCSAPFELSEGEPGMVMIVFNSPTDDLVFKIIRDRFAYPKKTTRQRVMQKYEYVFRHDRAGRLLDVQAFEQLKFPRACFSGKLLAELQQHAATSVEVDASHVVLKHAYIERRVTPLNIYLKHADTVAAHRAVIDYGNAIKDLAKSDIFPGDMLLKNFGVTRLGRIVFYDYDELCPLHACRFDSLEAPPAVSSWKRPSDALSATFEETVYPEAFRVTMGLDSDLKSLFMKYHADVLETEFWAAMQRRIADEQWIRIPPYAENQRLRSAPRDRGRQVWN